MNRCVCLKDIPDNILKITLTLYHTIQTFKDPYEKDFGKHCGKRGKRWYPAFSPFPTVFSTLLKREIIILAMFKFSSADAFNLVMSKILLFGKDLNTIQSNCHRIPYSESPILS